MPGSEEQPEDSGTFPPSTARSEVSGSARDVVQAYELSGGVHFYRTEPDAGRIPRQLPGDVRGFVNRVTELERLDAVLTEQAGQAHAISVLVLDGTAGAGKTSLAVHWAHRIRDQFPDGQLYVNLRGYDAGAPIRAADALDQFLRAFSIRTDEIPAELQSKAALYRSLVADRRLLIVLDNAATVGQVRPLLPGSSSCLVLVTSRSRLRGLAVREGARHVPVDPLSETDAVDLVQAVTNGYRVNDEPGELRELTRLCAQLPLALRIAAERAASRPRMPLAELIQDLRDESALWDALSTEDDEEASAVRTVFAWSYRALPAGTARLFRLLGLHPGPEFSVEAAAAMAASNVRDVRSVLHTLTGAHLLEETGRDRYQFHDLLRLYALDQAHQDESEQDQQAAVGRVLNWYLYSAIAATIQVNPPMRIRDADLAPVDSDTVPMSFSDYHQALAWYDAERLNLMAAVHAAANAGFDQIAWQIPATLGSIYGYRDAVGAWLAYQQVGLEAARRVAARHGEGLVLETLGVQYRLSDRLPEASDYCRAALTAFQATGDQLGETRTLLELGLIHRRRRQLTEARQSFEQAMALSAELDDRTQAALLHRNLGGIYLDAGELVEAENQLMRAEQMFRDINQEIEDSITLRYIAAVRIELGRLTEGRESLEQALAIARDHDDPVVEASTLLEFSQLELAEGATDACLATSQQAATMLRQLGRRSHEALALAVTAGAYRRSGRLEDATAFYRRTVTIQRDLGDRWQLAVALNNLGTVLHEMGQRTEAQASWQEVTVLIADYSDVRAEALRAEVDRRLNQEDPSS